MPPFKWWKCFKLPPKAATTPNAVNWHDWQYTCTVLVHPALYNYTLQCTSTLCTVSVHSALYQYTLHGTIYSELYQYTLHCTRTICTVPVHSLLYQYTLYCTSTLFTVPLSPAIHCGLSAKGRQISFCLIRLFELEAFYKFKRGQI